MMPFFISTIQNDVRPIRFVTEYYMYTHVYTVQGRAPYHSTQIVLAYTHQPSGPESMAQLLHQTFTLPVFLNEGEQVPTHKQSPSIIQPW